MPLVSVIVRSMNRPTLSETLESIALQHYSEIEVVVVNASGKEHQFLPTSCDKLELQLIGNGESLARSEAANYGLDQAKGKYILFLDDDDWIDPPHIENLVEALENDSTARVAYTGIKYVKDKFDQDGMIFNEPFDPIKLRVGNYIPIHAVLFEHSLTESCRIDESFDLYEDWDFWLQLSQLTHFIHIPEITGSYRSDGESQASPFSNTGSNTDIINQARSNIYEKWRKKFTGKEIEQMISYAMEYLNSPLRKEIKELGEGLEMMTQHSSQLQERLESTEKYYKQELSDTQEYYKNYVKGLNEHLSQLQQHLDDTKKYYKKELSDIRTDYQGDILGRQKHLEDIQKYYKKELSDTRTYYQGEILSRQKHLEDIQSSYQEQLVNYKEEITNHKKEVISYKEEITNRQIGYEQHIQDSNVIFQKEMQQARDTVDLIYNSTSWRVTKPLRWLSRNTQQIIFKRDSLVKDKQELKTELEKRIIEHPELTEVTKTITIEYNEKNGLIDFEQCIPYAGNSPGRIAIHIHIFYADLADEIASYLANMPFKFDLYISVADEHAKKICNDVFTQLEYCQLLEIQIVLNQGRDIAPMFYLFGDKLSKYDFIAHLHSKKSLYNKGATEGWREYLFSSLLGSSQTIRKIFTLMSASEPTGIVYPQNYSLVPYMANTWLANKAKGYEFCQKLSISNIPKGYFNFPAGSMFWARADALAPLFKLNMALDDFPQENAQKDGTLAHCLERMLGLTPVEHGFKLAIIPDTQQPNWSAWRFDNYLNHNKEGVKAWVLRPAIKLVVFDIFDTLLSRPLLEPEHTKQIVARKVTSSLAERYLKYRTQAEQQAREKAKKDVALEMIYQELKELADLTEEEANTLRHHEESVEIALLSPRSEVIELLNSVIDSGIKVVLASDMFLPKAIILQILKQHNINYWSHLYLSNDVGLRKDSEALYHHILSNEQRKPSEVIMIGDNERSDVQIPGDLGFQVFHIMRPLELARAKPRLFSLINQYEMRNDLDAELTLGLVLQHHYSNLYFPEFEPKSILPHTAFAIGHGIAGPLLLAFCQWLGDSAKKDGINTLFFLSREGEIIKKVYDLWQSYMPDTPKSEYLVISRRAVTVALIENLEHVLTIASSGFYGGTVGMFLKERYGLELSQQQWQSLSQSLNWSENDELYYDNNQIEIIKPLLTALLPDILKQAQQELIGFDVYMEQIGLKNRSAHGVVDIGYSGTIQKSLNRLLKANPADGYYFITDEKIKKVSTNNHVKARGCFVEQAVRNDSAPVLFLESFQLEKLLSSDNEQIVNYCYSTENGLKANYRSLEDKEKQVRTIRAEIQEGIFTYVKEAIKLKQTVLEDFSPSITVAKDLAEIFLTHRSEAEEKILSQIILDDHYCGRGLVG